MCDKKISVVINTYNASLHLQEVLETVKTFDEILICDMESTDNTLLIAKQYGCKIVTFPKGNNTICEVARMFAIQSTTYPWVFVVDADELVPQKLRDYLYQLIGKEDCPQGVYIPRKNYFMNHLCNYPDYQLRFFIKEGTIWPSYVHAVPMVKGTKIHLPRQRDDLAFIHLAEDNISLRVSKTNQYTDNEKPKKYSGASLCFKPLWRFIHSFFINGGFLQGKRGYIDAMLNMFYKFITIAKSIEASYENPD